MTHTSAMRDWCFDLETICNIFTCTMIHAVTGETRVYEISDWVDDTQRLMAMLHWMQQTGARLVGFNNEGFDYPILHALLTGQARGYKQLYAKAQSIIASQDRFGTRVWDNEKIIPQMDLYLIHHFDNDAKRTSLKTLEFNMRSHLVQEMPVPHDVPITYDQRETVLRYNFHDVAETLKFYWESRAEIEFRETLTQRTGVDHTNYNDGKIGKELIIRKLESIQRGTCFTYEAWTDAAGKQREKKTVRQTKRALIHIGEVILPAVQFDDPEFRRIHHWLAQQSITETKGVFNDLIARTGGIEFKFGTGGIHGSLKSIAFESNDEWVTHDADVGAMYPSIGVAWRLYPEHLGEGFCDVHGGIVDERQTHKKGTAPNAMLKLASNVPFGDSNNPYSPFLDPKYTMSITVNGQLLICMLAEKLIALPDVRLIQANTDGLTVYCKRTMLPLVKDICAWWEGVTRLKLEHATYSRMWIRDVNNYVAEFAETGKLKRKGAYEYDREWHQDHSELIVAKAVEAALVEGANIAQFIHGHTDIFDFMLRAKVPRASRLELDDGTPLPNIVRYYVSVDGKGLQKFQPPPAGYKIGDFKKGTGVSDGQYMARNRTGVHDPSIHTKNMSMYDTRKDRILAGHKVTICNHINEARRETIDFNYYIREAESLAAAAGYRRPDDLAVDPQ